MLTVATIYFYCNTYLNNCSFEPSGLDSISMRPPRRKTATRNYTQYNWMVSMCTVWFSIIMLWGKWLWGCAQINQKQISNIRTSQIFKLSQIGLYQCRSYTSAQGHTLMNFSKQNFKFLHQNLKINFWKLVRDFRARTTPWSGVITSIKHAQTIYNSHVSVLLWWNF